MHAFALNELVQLLDGEDSNSTRISQGSNDVGDVARPKRNGAAPL